MQEPPQLENGHIRIANALFDAILAFPFSKREQSVVLAVLRKTYGYRKKTDRISGSQITMLTGIRQNHVAECLTELFSKNVITKEDCRGGNILGINKSYWEWTSPKTGPLVPKQDMSQNRTKPSPELGSCLVPKQDTQQTKIQTKIKTRAISIAAFWAGYPRKTAKGQADRAWLKLTNDERTAAITALQNYPFSDDPKFIKHPATWLNAHCWLDELPSTNGFDSDPEPYL